jgi:hypothetical protein
MFIIHVTSKYGKGTMPTITPRIRRIGMDDALPKTMSVPAAGRKYFGLGKNGSYDAARRGDIPTIKIGARLFVPVVALERMLDGTSNGRDNRG